MPQIHKRIWITVMDSSRARFLKLENGQLLAACPVVLADSESRGHSRELKSDRPGRNMSSARSGVRHAIEPQHDYHKLEKRKFAARVAELLGQAFERRQFNELILVAPRRSLGELRGLLSANVQACLRHEIPKDLMKHETSDLQRQLAPFLMIHE